MTKKINWIFLIITILGLSVSWPLFKSGYFSHQDDLQVIRPVEMRKCFSDFQIPCRWVPDMGWGNGFPLFNFYGVSTYYLGGLLSYLVGFITASKILFFVALVAGSYGIYLLVQEIWGKYAGLTSSVLYLLAPYKALDIYVRGALAESMAIALIPFVFYFSYKKNYKLFVITLFLFLITHNIMTIIFLPVLLLWLFYWIYVNKFENIKEVIVSLLFAFGLSSFFVIPAFLEKSLVQTESLTRFELDFRANFVSLRQLFFDRVWGYGTSIPGPEGGMNFQIGWPHWMLVLYVLCYMVYGFAANKKKYISLITYYLLLFIFSIFMTHNKSSFIWESFTILSYFQFPWRFLSLSIFTSSILGGFIVFSFSEKYRAYAASLIIILTILLNWSYFKPREFYSVSDFDKTTGELWEQQRKGAILDYLPKTALEPREAAPTLPLVISGEANLTNFVNKSNSFEFSAEVLKESVIDVPVYYFPNWVVFVDGKEYPSNHDNLLGRISINLPEGEYEVSGRFKNTPLRILANTITVISFVGFLIWKKYQK